MCTERDEHTQSFQTIIVSIHTVSVSSTVYRDYKAVVPYSRAFSESVEKPSPSRLPTSLPYSLFIKCECKHIVGEYLISLYIRDLSAALPRDEPVPGSSSNAALVKCLDAFQAPGLAVL